MTISYSISVLLSLLLFYSHKDLINDALLTHALYMFLYCSLIGYMYFIFETVTRASRSSYKTIVIIVISMMVFFTAMVVFPLYSLVSGSVDASIDKICHRKVAPELCEHTKTLERIVRWKALIDWMICIAISLIGCQMYQHIETFSQVVMTDYVSPYQAPYQPAMEQMSTPHYLQLPAPPPYMLQPAISPAPAPLMAPVYQPQPYGFAHLNAPAPNLPQTNSPPAPRMLQKM